MGKEDIKAFCEKVIDKQICNECRKKRNDFEKEDQTPTGPKKADKVQIGYCPAYIGFWNDMDKLPHIPIDVLVITESHGGGSWKEWINKSTYERAEGTCHWYWEDDIESFFQWNIKKITQGLDNKPISWFVTDLVKCYVYKKNKPGIGLDNFEEAISHCKVHLMKQIKTLNPRIVLILGKKYKELVRSLLRDARIKEERILAFCLPVGWNADEWATLDGSEGVVREVSNKLKTLEAKK